MNKNTKITQNNILQGNVRTVHGKTMQIPQTWREYYWHSQHNFRGSGVLSTAEKIDRADCVFLYVHLCVGVFKVCIYCFMSLCFDVFEM